MDFIVQNYVWFIVGGIIILMAIIGYIADKTDFGRNFKTEKPKKQKPKEEKRERIKLAAKGINELTEKAIEQERIDNNVPVKDQTVDNNNLNVVEPVDETINNENIDQSLFAPLTDNSIGDVNKMVTESPQNIELKSIEPVKLNEETAENSSTNAEVASNDDIWKF